MGYSISALSIIVQIEQDKAIQSTGAMTDQKTDTIDVLDHAAVMVNDLHLSACLYERLGFYLTPLSQHSGALTPGGDVVQWGCANRCIMLQQGYLELMGVVDTNLYDNKIPEFLARYEGIHILAFGCTDGAASANRLAKEGFGANGVHGLARSVDTPDGERKAEFSLVRIPPEEMPEGRVLAIEHLTPEYLWQDRYMTHPNGAIALEELILCVDDPATVASRYERYFGIPASEENNLWRFTLRQGRFVLTTAETLSAEFDINPPTTPYAAAIKIRTQTLNNTKELLTKNGVTYTDTGHGIKVPASEAAGATFIFTE
jgi:hypothetical protein